MLRQGSIWLGSFILNERVIADWWHPYYRLDVYKKARTRLAAIQEIVSSSASSTAKSQCEGEDDKNSSKDKLKQYKNSNFVSDTFYEQDQAQLDEQHDLQWEQQLYGGALESSFTHNNNNNRDENNSNDAADEEERFRASLEAALTNQPHFSLYEANALVGTFTSYHSDVELSTILQFIREHVGQELCNYHYHALLRVFNYNHDKANTLQLLDVMLQRDELTHETYARIMDSVHCLMLSPNLDKLLRVVQLAHEAFGSLVFNTSSGSEAMTVAAYGNSEAAHAASITHDKLPSFHNEELEETSLHLSNSTEERSNHITNNNNNGNNNKQQLINTSPSPSPLSSSSSLSNVATVPVLTSLLYHVCNTGEAGGPVGALLIALWIRALNVQLGDWDYVMIMCSLLAQMEVFPLVRLLFGAFFEFPRFTVSVQAVLSRVTKQSSVLQLPSDLITLVQVMSESLAVSSVDLQEPIVVGVVNTQTTQLESMLDCIIHNATQHGSVGPFGYNSSELFHVLSIIYSVRGNNSRAAEVFVRAYEASREAQSEFFTHSITTSLAEVNKFTSLNEQKVNDTQHSENSHCGTVSSNSNKNNNITNNDNHCEDEYKTVLVPSRLTCEPFEIDFKYVLDIATLFPKISEQTLQRLKPAFLSISHSTTEAANEEELRRTTSFSFDSSILSSYNTNITSTEDNNNNDNNNNSSGSNSGNSGNRSYNNNSNSEPMSEGVLPTTLIAPQRAPTLADAMCCEAMTIPFIQTYEQARKMLQRITDSIDLTKNRHTRGTRVMIKQFADFCAQHSRRNCKLTSIGYEERQKWGRYIQARDTALCLYGSVRQARDAMRHLFYHDNKLPPLRSTEMILKDVDDVAKIVFPGKEALVRDAVQHELCTRRTSQPHLRFAADEVPRHLWDPEVYNYYPHIMLKCTANKFAHNAEQVTCHDNNINSNHNANNTERSEIHENAKRVYHHYIDDDENKNENDLFAELWRTLMNRKIMGNDVWFLQNAEMYVSLMRCLLYRLDWEAAVHLTSKIQEFNIYNHYVDAELNAIFVEIGDPAGCLAFKVATKLFDGRILHHGTANQRANVNE